MAFLLSTWHSQCHTRQFSPGSNNIHATQGMPHFLRCAAEARLLVFTITEKTLFQFSVSGNFPFCSQGSSQSLLYIGKNSWIMPSKSYIFKNKELLFLEVEDAQIQSFCTYLGKWENACPSLLKRQKFLRSFNKDFFWISLLHNIWIFIMSSFASLNIYLFFLCIFLASKWIHKVPLYFLLGIPNQESSKFSWKTIELLLLACFQFLLKIL